MSHAVYSRFRVEEVPARKMCTTLTAGSVNSKQRKHVLILTITSTPYPNPKRQLYRGGARMTDGPLSGETDAVFRGVYLSRS